MVTLNTLVFSVFGTDVPKTGTGYYKYGQRKNCKLQIAGENIIHETLMLTNKIIFLPLHIKLGLMKQYVKMLDKMNTVSEVYVAHFLVLVRRN